MKYYFISGQGESAAEEKPVEEGLQPNQEPSPDDLSSPNADHAAPLLQAQQRPPSRVEREETCPGSASGTGTMEVEMTASMAVSEGTDIQSSTTGPDRDQPEQERAPEKDSEQERTLEKDRDDKETVDLEMVDEGLPPSKGSEDDSWEESEGQREPSDPNNNSLETPQDHQDDSIDIPEAHTQVCQTDIRLQNQ